MVSEVGENFQEGFEWSRNASDANGENLQEEWRRFKQHAELKFTSPLNLRSETVICLCGQYKKAGMNTTLGKM